MKHIVCSSLLLLLLVAMEPPSHALVLPSLSKLTNKMRLFSTPTPIPKKPHQKSTSDVMLTEMRADIERMKKEAAERLEVLNEKLIVVSKQKEEEEKARAIERQQQRHATRTLLLETNEKEKQNRKKQKQKQKQFHQDPALALDPTPAESSSVFELDDAKALESLTEMADEFQRDMGRLDSASTTGDAVDSETTLAATAISTATATATATPPAVVVDPRHPLKLLDDTRWRLCLNVGRVPGTWMPKTWGASGDKLHLKLEVEFTSDELYEQEAFFNGISDGSKVLRVVHHEAALAPSMNEGGKAVRISDGGWKVCPKEGPLGTHILRFYFDVEEEARHLGSDVYLPKGRVFGTCGYFPMIHRSNVDGMRTSKRELYQQELRQMEVKFQSLQNELSNHQDWFSLSTWKCYGELRDLQKDVRKIRKALDEETVREPKKSSLRLSRDQSVGLTREGGICCKKATGLSDEYHILGRFEVASIENREHSDYRDALRP